MLRIKGREYSGHVIKGDDEITAVISTSDDFQDVVAFMIGVTEVTEYDGMGNMKSYAITVPISTSVISPHVFGVRFSTKPTHTQMLEAKNQELSDAIDDILIMMLEG